MKARKEVELKKMKPDFWNFGRRFTVQRGLLLRWFFFSSQSILIEQVRNIQTDAAGKSQISET